MSCGIQPVQPKDTFYGFGCREFAVAPYVDDPKNAVWQELYSIQSVSVGNETTTAEMMGNDIIQETAGMLKSITLDIENGKIDFSGWAVMNGGTYIPADSTQVPPVPASITLSQGCFLPYFMVKFQALDTAGGSIVVQCNKCQLSDVLSSDFSQENFVTFSASIKCIADVNKNIITFSDIKPATLIV